MLFLKTFYHYVGFGSMRHRNCFMVAVFPDLGHRVPLEDGKLVLVVARKNGIRFSAGWCRRISSCLQGIEAG